MSAAPTVVGKLKAELLIASDVRLVLQNELEQAQARLARALALADKWESVTEVWDELIAGDWITLSLTEQRILKGLAKQLRAALAEGDSDETQVG